MTATRPACATCRVRRTTAARGSRPAGQDELPKNGGILALEVMGEHCDAWGCDKTCDRATNEAISPCLELAKAIYVDPVSTVHHDQLHIN